MDQIDVIYYPDSSGAFMNSQTITSLPQVVAPAPLTITADNETMFYGTALPTLSASYTGFVNDDTPANLTTLPTLITTATASSPGGSYDIDVSGAVDPNYNISYVTGTLTIAVKSVEWTGGPSGTGTNWDDASNWAGGVLPTVDDDVSIDTASPTTITVQSGLAHSLAIASGDTLALTGGSLTIAANSTLDCNFNFSDGTLVSDGNVTLAGTVNWSGGTMTGTGTTVIAGTVNWTDGTMAGTTVIAAGGTLLAMAHQFHTGW